MLTTLSCIALVMWFGLLLLPWRPWGVAEQISAETSTQLDDLTLDEITVLIPARNEAACIAETLKAVNQQGTLGRIILVDDQSDDGTAAIACAVGCTNLTIIDGTQPPADWSGKLWALKQGFEHVHTPYVLLLDADISLSPNILKTVFKKLNDEQLDTVSIMAQLYMGSWSEKLLLPAFIYFFKILYPFRLVNSPRSRIAGAAGGFVLARADKIREIGGFASLSGAIIDDCTLAKKIKRHGQGGKIWLGLSRDVLANRPYENLSTIWNMVARTAYTQLRYSIVLLLICTALLTIGYIVPLVSLLTANAMAKVLAALALSTALYSYWPINRYYQLSPAWVVSLPIAACLFLAMTWTSAWRYFRGERSRWKNRSYTRPAAD